MGGFERVLAEYCQFRVITDGNLARKSRDAVGDNLVRLHADDELTVMTGLHTGWIRVRVATLSQPPEDAVDGDAASEATLWCPTGRISVCSLLGDGHDGLTDIAAPGSGLLRFRVSARHRRRDGATSPVGPPEEYEILVWPVREDVGLRTIRADELPDTLRTNKVARVAGWAMVRLVTRANPRRRGWGAGRRPAKAVPVRRYDRVDVLRSRRLPAALATTLLRRPGDFFGAAPDGDDLVLGAGGVEVRLSAAGTAIGLPDVSTMEWRWTPAPGSVLVVPDEATSSVELRLHPQPGEDTAVLTVAHRGVRTEDAVLLGMLWDYWLHRAESLDDRAVVPPHPWHAQFDDYAAEPARQAATARPARAASGVTPPPPEPIVLVGIDPGALGGLAAATAAQQRDLARWAARRACTAAGLTTVAWIADGLAAAERGTPPPPPFDDDTQAAARLRLLSDPDVPSTVVTAASGMPSQIRQVFALRAIFAARGDDPLAAAVDALTAAASIQGAGGPDLFADARAAFPFLGTA